MDDSNTGGSFEGVPIDYRAEYIEARRLMGLKSTDQDRLIETVALLYFNCPESYNTQYAALLNEISDRQRIKFMHELGL
jgi:hypothetical protein